MNNMDEKIQQFNNAVLTQIARYRMTRRENPSYIIINAAAFQVLRKNYLTSFGQNGSEYYAGLKVLIDNDLTDFSFRIVGE